MSKTTKFFFGISFSLLIASMLSFIYILNLFQPVNPQDKQIVKFVIPKGAAISAVAQKLQAQGLTKSQWALRLYLKLNPVIEKIQAGSFELSPSMNVAAIVETFNQGTNDIWITFPEGLRREEIAQSLAEYDLAFYDQSKFLSQTVGLTGQLFPDTYLVPKEITTQALIILLTNTFEQKIEALSVEIDNSDHTFNELLTMASILEREARGATQMQQVAGVLWRRLAMGMPLQVDATLQYAKGYNDQTLGWWTPPLAVDKELVSKFNTYLNPGLPPHPICNPGYDAIYAALKPIASSYIFYIHDNDGNIHFATTLDEHNTNVNRYLR